MDQESLTAGDRDGATIAAFEAARPALVGMTYRMLGSHADTEDVLQDVFLRWAGADRASTRKPAAWLMTLHPAVEFGTALVETAEHAAQQLGGDLGGAGPCGGAGLDGRPLAPVAEW